MKPRRSLVWWVALVSFLPLHSLSAQSALAVLEYHQKGSSKESVQKFTDRLREEFIRRGEIATLSKGQTEEIFYYHRNLLSGESPYQQKMRVGKEAYYNLRLPEAEQALRGVIQGIDRGGGLRGVDDGTLLEARLLLGLTLAAEQNEAGAREVFREALRQNPNLQINPQFFPPKIVKLFRSVASHADFQTTALTIHSQPEGGKVYLNGVLAGVTPLALPNFPTGDHVVRVEAGPRVSQVKRVSLQRPLTVTLPLAWQAPQNSSKILGFTTQEAPDNDHLLPLASQAGQQLGVQKVLLVSLNREAGKEVGEVRLIDTSLRASYKLHSFEADHVAEQSAELAAHLASEMTPEIRSNLLVGAKGKVEDRYSGDVLLLGKYHPPLYKRPLFWVVLGLAGAGGGVGAAVVGGAAAAGSLVVVF